MFERALKSVDVVETLAGEITFAEEVLVDVGDCGCVRIDAGVTREDLHKLRSRGTRQRDADAWLQDSVAASHAMFERINARLVQWMNCGTDEFACSVTRELSVGVERYNVAYRAQ